jgi:hypothetical protein
MEVYALKKLQSWGLRQSGRKPVQVQKQPVGCKSFNVSRRKGAYTAGYAGDNPPYGLHSPLAVLSCYGFGFAFNGFMKP